MRLPGRVSQTPDHSHGWRSREDSQSSTQDQTAYCPALLHPSHLTTPAPWLLFPTHNLAQTAHLMDGSWRELVSLAGLTGHSEELGHSERLCHSVLLQEQDAH